MRATAAKQLAQVAAKSVRSDVGDNDDVNKLRLHESLVDPNAWAELMSVVARVSVSSCLKLFILLLSLQNLGSPLFALEVP